MNWFEIAPISIVLKDLENEQILHGANFETGAYFETWANIETKTHTYNGFVIGEIFSAL